jgi:hypothetical protein
MNCAKVKRWLHFYRPEELKPHEQQAIEKHLITCASCRTISHEIQRLSTSTDLFRKTVPDLAEPWVIPDRIMSAIEHQKRHVPSNKRFLPWYWMARPGISLACGCLLLFNMGIFFIQEIQITNQISRLEQKMKRSASVPKSVFAQCLDSAHDIENILFNSEIDGFIHQIQSFPVQEVQGIRTAFLFRQLSAGQQLKLIKACHQLNDRYRFYQSLKSGEPLKKEPYLKGVLP